MLTRVIFREQNSDLPLTMLLLNLTSFSSKALCLTGAVSDWKCSQATEAAIAVANIGLTKDDAQGVTRPSSPVDEETQRLIDENAALKKQVDSLRGTVREKERQGTLTGKGKCKWTTSQR